MLDIAGYQVGILVFSDLHDDLIENYIFGVYHFLVDGSRIQKAASLTNSVQNSINQFGSEFEFRTV